MEMLNGNVVMELRNGWGGWVVMTLVKVAFRGSRRGPAADHG